MEQPSVAQRPYALPGFLVTCQRQLIALEEGKGKELF